MRFPEGGHFAIAYDRLRTAPSLDPSRALQLLDCVGCLTIGLCSEDSTLESKDKRLLRTVCRKAALTVKPCNKPCVVGVVEDPNAPKGFKQKPDDSLKLNEHPNYTRLGGSELQFNPVLDGDVLQRALAKVESVRKALEAGNYNVAPSAITGVAALQVQDRSLHLAHLRNQARAALRDWDRKTPFREVLKHKLPEASDDFIDRFSNLVDNYTMKVRKAQESFSKCMECSKPPRYEARWAEGMARVWFCEDHWPQWKKKHQDDIDFVRKLTDARVGSKYGEAPGVAPEKKEAAVPRKPGTRGHQSPSFKQWVETGKSET